MFEIGETVLCIDSAKQPHTQEELSRDVPNWVVKGNKYTIRAIVDYDFTVGVLLEEITNSPKYFKLLNKVCEPAFATWRFRKTENNKIEINEEKLETV